MNIFTQHPASVGETYFEHMRFAARFGGRMTLGGMASLLHAVLPFCCVTTGSRTSDELIRMRAAARGRTARVVDAETLQPLDWQI
jgi:hypothetical protein